MRNQLIITSAAFGFGALLGWCVTADLKEAKAKRNRVALRDVINSQSELINHLQLSAVKQGFKINLDTSAFEESVREAQEAVDELQEMLPFEDDEPAEVRLLSEAHPEMLSLDAEANAFGETIHVLDGKNSAEGSSDETSGTDVVAEDDEENPVPPGETEEETRSNLQDLIDQYTQNPDDIDRFVNHAERQTAPGRKPPFVISRQLYAWDPDEGDDYRKVTISYYPNDRVLLDEDEDVIEDVEWTVGWRSLAQFGFESDDPDVVFVRCPELETDFEIIREIENPLPLHVKYAMSKDEFMVNKAAGNIRFRQEDRD